MAKQTQCEKILRHLRAYGTITPHTALFEYSIMRLASRINDLRQDGYPIRTEMLTRENKFGEPVRFACYHLEARK